MSIAFSDPRVALIGLHPIGDLQHLHQPKTIAIIYFRMFPIGIKHLQLEQLTGLSIFKQAKYIPVDLRSFDPPLAKKFALRQLALMETGVSRQDAQARVESEMRDSGYAVSLPCTAAILAKPRHFAKRGSALFLLL